MLGAGETEMLNVNGTQSQPDDSGPPRRRSARLSSPTQTVVNSVLSENNKETERTPSGESLQKKSRMSTLGPAQAPDLTAKRPVSARSITVRKIVPRKTNVLSKENNKENVQRTSGGHLQNKPKMSTPGPAEVPLPKAAVLSPILPPSTGGVPEPAAPQDPVWAQKVRRSYSRLSLGDKSFESPQPQPASSPSLRRRDSLFGFEKLQTPEVVWKTGQPEGGADVSRSLFGVSSFTLLEGDKSAASPPEVDVNIPGVALVKEKRRRKRVPQMNLAELDVLAAQMNAEFDEAEGFELVVE